MEQIGYFDKSFLSDITVGLAEGTYGPTDHLYMENMTAGPMRHRPWTIQLCLLKNAAPFDIEKH
jgi:hypothetical protein